MTTQPFEADTGRVLNIVINSLYSEKEIFLRELISNSSDAVDKRRFQKLSGQSTEKDSVNYEIEIGISPKDQILTISDNGIGMDKDDLISSLGTIAKSGTTEFLDQLEKVKKNDETKSVNLIGQFGVGFYAAFITAALSEPGRIKYYIDQNPHLEGRTLNEKPIIHPKNFSSDVQALFVGLNPDHARDIIKQLETLQGLKTFFL